MIRGVVEKGSGRGKTEFVPTVNLMLEETPADLDYGIYCCAIYIGGKKYFGALHYGERSTIDDLVTFEVNIFDFNEDIYGEEVEVEVFDKIREIVKFRNKEELQTQIEQDILDARKLLKLDA